MNSRRYNFGKLRTCVISGSCRGVNEICCLLGFYVAYNGIFLPKFCDKYCWILEDGNDILSRKVGKKLPLYAA
jgi:hypothetical protein